MIFTANNPKNNKCEFTIDISGKNFYCVYRGHSYYISKRLESHLFYNENVQYPNCMKYIVNYKKYNINISTKKLYSNGKADDAQEFPTETFAVATMALSNTKQGIRELFEIGFDKAYNRPIFSSK